MIAIYIRVSTEKQDEGMQLNAIKRVLTIDGINIEECKIYKDHGITGSTTERPDYQRLLVDITTGIFDKIVCYEYSRLWRDLQEQSRMFKVLKVLNIRLQSATEGYVDTDEDEFKANVLGAANVYELKRTRRRSMEAVAKKKKLIEEGKDIWKGRGKDKKLRKRPEKKEK